MGDGHSQRTKKNEIPLNINARVQSVIDAGDVWIKRTAYQKSDLAIDSTENIVSEYINDDGDIKYKEIELSKNAAGEIIKTEIIGYTNAPPTWAVALFP